MIARASTRSVLFVLNTADLYGAARSVLRLIAQLAVRGIRPVVMLPCTGPLLPMLERAGGTIVVDPSITIITRQEWRPWSLLKLLFTFPRSVFRIARLARRERVDLIHTNAGVIVSPALAAWLVGVPHIWHVRESFDEFSSVWRLYSTYMLALSNRILAVSSAMADQFPRSEKVTVVHDGIERDEFENVARSDVEAFRSRFGLGNDLVVGCVGRIKLVRKGQENLVHAAALLKSRGILARYLIVGSPAPGSETHLSRLQELVSSLGVEREVVFTGELADPRPAYAAMNVFALTSATPEPFGGVVLEAMMMGLPVVGTAIGGTPEQISDGVTGFLVPPADPTALAAKLELLLRSEELRASMGNRGQQRVRELFSLTRHVAQVMAIHDEVVSSTVVPAAVES